MLILKAIANVDKNWGIGAENDLLFHIPDDMKFFRKTTLNKVVIMGRKTLETLPNSKPFKDRKNIILTRDKNFSMEDCTVFNDTSELLEHIKQYDKDEVFVVGGGEIYSLLLPFCDTAIITKTLSEKNATAFFPNIDTNTEWTLSQQSDEHEYEGIKFKFCIYKRT